MHIIYLRHIYLLRALLRDVMKKYTRKYFYGGNMEPFTIGLLVTWGLSLILVFGFSIINYLFLAKDDPIPDPTKKEEELASKQNNKVEDVTNLREGRQQELVLDSIVDPRNNVALSTTNTHDGCFLTGPDQPPGTMWLTASLDTSVGGPLYFGFYYTVSENSKDSYSNFYIDAEYFTVTSDNPNNPIYSDVRSGDVLYVNCLQYGLRLIALNSYDIYYYLAFGDGTGTNEDEGESNIKVLQTYNDKGELTSDGNEFYLSQGYVYQITYVGLQYRGDSDQYRQTFAVKTALADNP